MFEKGANIFIVGIGGIGTSGLARIFYHQGIQVSGSDSARSEITAALGKEGVSVVIGHKPENLQPGADVLVYSNAVPATNSERLEGRKRGIKEFSYPEAVGELTKDYRLIAVAGTNGKTTTTAMLATVLVKAGLDPTALVGSTVLAWNSNARIGKGQYFVLEADEYRRAFLNYVPEIAVITNIEEDHLDYYRDLKDIKTAFSEFVGRIKPGGALIYNAEEENTVEVAGSAQVKTVSFAVDRAARVNEKNLEMPGLQVPGRFNRANAFAAAAVAQALGIPNSVIASALAKFAGTWRRFETVGRVGETAIISDYAHHPDGIRVTLETAVQLYDAANVLLVFQPHQHSRTKKLFKQFIEVLCATPVQNIIIPEIFDVAGREAAADQDISSNDLVREIVARGKRVQYAQDLAHCEKLVRRNLYHFKAVIFMGAGDIYKVAESLVKK